MLGCETTSLVGIDLDALVGVSRVVYSGGIVVQTWIRVFIVDYLPYIEDGVAFSSTLHTVQLEDSETIPVVMVWGELCRFDLSGKVPLNTFKSINERLVSRVPQNAVVLHCGIHQLFQKG